MSKKINTTWRDFLSSPPYFHSKLFDSVSYEEASSLADMPRAAYYYCLFDAEVSNGGVMQYFFNLAFYLADFEKADEFVRAHPVLSEALPFMEAAHAAWAENSDKVYDARFSPTSPDEWPEELFSDTNFEELENTFFAVNHQITMRLDHHILQHPEAYFSFETIPDLTGQGAELLSHHGATLRFVDGFPEGPNLLPRKKGADMIWISRNRSRLDFKSTDWTGESDIYGWIDYPSQRSHRVQYGESGVETIENRIADWIDHGSRETFDGGVSSHLTFAHNGDEIKYGFPSKDTGVWEFHDGED